MRIHEIIESAADSFDQALEKPAAKPGALNFFKKGTATGYNNTNKFIKDLPYSKLGRAARGASRYFKQVNKGPTIK